MRHTIEAPQGSTQELRGLLGRGRLAGRGHLKRQEQLSHCVLFRDGQIVTGDLHRHPEPQQRMRQGSQLAPAGAGDHRHLMPRHAGVEVGGAHL